MHASLNELLTLRDEVVVDGAIAAHVQTCGECRTELDRLRTVTTGLRALPHRQAPTLPDLWPAIQRVLALHRLSEEQEEIRQPGWRWPLAAAAAVLVTVAALTWQGERESVPAVVMIDAAGTSQTALAVRSRQLEHVLAVLPDQPSVTRASTALTLAELQDRISWVDYRLALGDEAGIEPQQSELLWQERVDLLNSLVAVRYAQTRTPF